MNETKRIGRHSIYSLIGNLLIAVLSFFITVFVTRKLGPENYGVFSYVLTVFIFLIPFTTIGLTSMLEKSISFYLGKRNSQYIKGTFLTITKAVFIITLIITSILFLFSGTLPYSNYIRIMLPYLILTSIFTIFISTFSSLRMIGIATLINVVSNILLLLFLFLLIGQGVTGALIAWQMSLLIPIVIFSYFLYKHIWKNIKAALINLKSVFSFSIPFFIGNSLSELTLYLNTFVLTYFAFRYGMVEVGFYSLALNLTMFSMNMVLFVTSAVRPAIIQFYGEGDLKKVSKTFNLSMKYTFMFVFPIIFTLITLGDVIILEIFKKSYVEAVPVLQILSLGIVFSVLIRMLLPFIYVKNKTKEYMWLSIANVAILLPLSFLLVPIWGAVGAAIARIFSLSIIMIYFFRLLTKIKIKFSRLVVFKEFICSMLFIVLLFVPRDLVSAIASWFIVTLFYLLMLYKLNVIGKTDMNRLINLK